MHAHSIVNDLAWILFAATVAALALHPFRIPLLIGYIVAGFLVGPHLGLWPALVELENVQELSELGVIFLLFYIGLEFDFGRLRRLIGPAFTALSLQTLLMLFLGMEASRLIGLSTMDGWFLGGLFSISSSMVSVKLIRERGLIHTPHASLTIGVLVLEDILAILLLVLLAGMAAEGSMNVQAIARSILFIAIFTVLVFLIGKLGAFRLTRFLVARGTTELVTMASLGLIFLVGLLAYKFNFSWALGGFLAGAILSRSQLAERIEQLTEPLRDMFSALFFVTVGMLIDPGALLTYAPIILALSFVIIVGKFASCWLGFFLAGRYPSEATRAALIKSQIGEFSFVIVSIGATYGATSSELQSIVSGVAFITILTTPTLIQNENRVLSWGKRFSPKAIKEFCAFYGQWVGTVSLSISRSAFLGLAKKPVSLLCIHFLIITGIIIAAALISQRLSPPEFLPMPQNLFQQAVFLLSVLASLPFLVDTMRNLNVLVWLFSEAAMSRPSFKQFSDGAYRSALNGLILLLLLFVYGTVFLLVAANYFPTGSVFVAFLAITGIVGWIFWKKLIHLHHQWETAIVNSMKNEAEERISQKISNSLKAIESREPWQVNVEPITLSRDSKWTGKQVMEIDLRSHSGAIIAGIERNGYELVSIDPDTHLYPSDKIFVLGEPEQIERAKGFLNLQGSDAESLTEPFIFTREVVPPRCSWDGMRIQDTQIRSRFRVTIVGIQKGEKRIIGPSPQVVLDEGDLILVMGSQENIENFKAALRGDREDAGSLA
ncbi:MAG: cation:proton antiporter [Verrucomicrobiota bacterium]|nr:cation:proton antiporter [Verrucomicrobiota bacterium]